jgi:hypothetical protein
MLLATYMAVQTSSTRSCTGKDTVTDFNKAEGNKATGNCENMDRGNGKKK